MSAEKPRDTSESDGQAEKPAAGSKTAELTDEQLASISGGPAEIVAGDIPKTGTEGTSPTDPGLLG